MHIQRIHFFFSNNEISFFLCRKSLYFILLIWFVYQWNRFIQFIVWQPSPCDERSIYFSQWICLFVLSRTSNFSAIWRQVREFDLYDLLIYDTTKPLWSMIDTSLVFREIFPWFFHYVHRWEKEVTFKQLLF